MVRKVHKLVGKFPYNTLCTGNIATTEQLAAGWVRGWGRVTCKRCLAARRRAQGGKGE